MARKLLNKTQTGGFKIGVYIRVSTEEQAQNIDGSIRNQEERLKAHVAYKNTMGDFGEIKKTFIDRARSGKDTNRPELQKLLKSIKTGEVDFVLVTELSRITRNIKDFSDIWDLLKDTDCGFQSLRENFDTTTAAGEMVLFQMANMAQSERRQTQERVSTNMNARAKRGLYNGGVVPFGYKLIEGKPGYLAVDEKQAEIVRIAFDAFLREESLSQAAIWLNKMGYRREKTTRGGGRFRQDFFTAANLHQILRNPAYIGLRSYKDQGELKEVKAAWPGVVDPAQFERVQKMLRANKSRKKTHSPRRHPYLLTGFTFCETCGDRLCGKSAHGKTKKIPYYEHGWRTRKGSTLTQKAFDCGNHRRFSGDKLEALVLGELEKIVNDKTFLGKLLDKAQRLHKNQSKPKEIEKLKSDIYNFNGQLEALAERLAQIPKSVSAKPIFNQMAKIGEIKAGKNKTLLELTQGELTRSNPPIEFKDFKNLLEGLKGILREEDPKAKAKVIRHLIHRIDVGKESVNITYKLDQSSLLREPIYLGSRLFLCPKSGKILPFGQDDVRGRGQKKAEEL